MYTAEKEGGNAGAAYAQLFLSAAAAAVFSAGIFLAICGIREGFLWAGRSCRRQWYSSLAFYPQEGLLGPKTSCLCFPKWTKTPTVDIHGKKQTCTDRYKKTSHLLPQPKELIRWKTVIQKLTLSTLQSWDLFLSKYFIWLNNCLGGQQLLVARVVLLVAFCPRTRVMGSNGKSHLGSCAKRRGLYTCFTFWIF